MDFDSTGCSENEDLENEDRRPGKRRPKTKTKNEDPKLNNC